MSCHETLLQGTEDTAPAMVVSCQEGESKPRTEKTDKVKLKDNL